MKRSSRIAAGTISAGLVVSSLLASHTFASMTTYAWSNSGGTLQNGSRSNVVGFWQVVGYTQVRCPGAFYDGIFGSNTTAQTKEMQRALPTPGTSIPVTGIVNTTTWSAIQNAWVYAIGTPANFQRLSPVSGAPGSVGDYSYYGGSGSGSANLAWGNSGGPIWKFQVYGTSSWFNSTSSRTMGSTSAC